MRRFVPVYMRAFKPQWACCSVVRLPMAVAGEFVSRVGLNR
jgi:hypothetical protein